MRIKVCGMRHPSNIQELVRLKPDYIGFIFYPESKRYIGTRIPEEVQAMIPVYIKKVGVFVDEPFGDLLEKFRDNRLDMVQLHGSELPDYCERVKKLGIPIIKVFSISADFDFEAVRPFEAYCDYYLFDTAGVQRGGTGIKFDWEKLDQYVGNKPFFLSGGIRPTDSTRIKGIFHKQLHAIDLNSGFETEPAIKDIPKLKVFLEGVRSL
jgi:phosphoribosylanthranilate isomerase